MRVLGGWAFSYGRGNPVGGGLPPLCGQICPHGHLRDDQCRGPPHILLCQGFRLWILTPHYSVSGLSPEGSTSVHQVPIFEFCLLTEGLLTEGLTEETFSLMVSLKAELRRGGLCATRVLRS